MYFSAKNNTILHSGFQKKLKSAPNYRCGRVQIQESTLSGIRHLEQEPGRSRGQIFCAKQKPEWSTNLLLEPRQVI